MPELKSSWLGGIIRLISEYKFLPEKSPIPCDFENSIARCTAPKLAGAKKTVNETRGVCISDQRSWTFGPGGPWTLTVGVWAKRFGSRWTAGNIGEGAGGPLAEGRSKRFFLESVLSTCWHVKFQRM